MSICLRRLQSNELDWANQRYSEVDFLPSAPSDLIVIATVEGQPAGLGRVSLLQPGVGELGGMVVFPAYRGRGIARLLIEWLIAESGLPTLYCLPFEDLAELYRSCGFALHEASSVPDKLRAKYTWCNNHYARRVLLMARQSATSS